MTERTSSTKLTSRLLKEKLKLGWTAEQFAKKLHISVDEFEDQLKKSFDGRAYEMFARDLSDNKKEQEKAEKRIWANNRKAFRKQMRESIEAARFEKSEESKEVVSDTMQLSEEDRIEKLSADAETARKLICELEVKHNDLVTTRKGKFQELSKIREEILNIKEFLEKKSKEAEETIKMISEVSDGLEQTNKELTDAKALLSELEGELVSLQKVEVRITESEVEILPVVYMIPDTWKQLRTLWLDDERFMSLTVTEISLLAKAVALKQNLLEQGKKFEFKFSSDRMQFLFEELTTE